MSLDELETKYLTGLMKKDAKVWARRWRENAYEVPRADEDQPGRSKVAGPASPGRGGP
jgi:hypothetical protein